MASFIFTCPHCKQQFNAEEEWIGESAECPGCQRTIIIQKTEQQPLSVSSHRSRSILKKIILCSVLAIVCISGALWITYMVVPSGITAKTKRSYHLPLLPDSKKSNDIDAENTCQSNLKQVLLAMTMYFTDSNGKYPPQKDWDKVLLKDYVTDKKLLSCPADSSLYSYLAGNIDSTEKLQEPSKIEILRCPKHRLVIFADGHVSHYSQQTNIAEKRVNEGDRVAEEQRIAKERARTNNILTISSTVKDNNGNHIHVFVPNQLWIVQYTQNNTFQTIDRYTKALDDYLAEYNRNNNSATAKYLYGLQATSAKRTLLDAYKTTLTQMTAFVIGSKASQRTIELDWEIPGEHVLLGICDLAGTFIFIKKTFTKLTNQPVNISVSVDDLYVVKNL